MFFESFPISSRYHRIETATMKRTDGHVIVYLRRRFLPSPDRFSLLQEHIVAAGERPDSLAARYLGAPEQFWQLADANGVLHPNELTETAGHRVRITLPGGIQKAPDE